MVRRKKVNIAVNKVVTAAKEREQDGKGRKDIGEGREIQEVEGKIAIATVIYVSNGIS